MISFICINIKFRTGTLDTPMKKYDLMNQINARGTYLWLEILVLLDSSLNF